MWEQKKVLELKQIVFSKKTGRRAVNAFLQDCNGVRSRDHRCEVLSFCWKQSTPRTQRKGAPLDTTKFHCLSCRFGKCPKSISPAATMVRVASLEQATVVAGLLTSCHCRVMPPRRRVRMRTMWRRRLPRLNVSSSRAINSERKLSPLPHPRQQQHSSQ